MIPRFSRQSGQGMVEYALILALVALIVLVALIATGGQVINLYSDIVTTMCNNHVGCWACSSGGVPSRLSSLHELRRASPQAGRELCMVHTYDRGYRRCAGIDARPDHPGGG